MYKFHSLRKALTSPLARGSLVFGLTLFSSSPVWAEATAEATPKASAKVETTKVEATKAPAPATEPDETKPSATAGPATNAAPSTTAAPAEPPVAEPTAEQREQARLAFEAGSKAFAEEKYEAALAEFKKAYEIIPSPHAEYWIAVSMDKADPETKAPKALAGAYETFLTNPGAGHVGSEQVASAKIRLEEIRKGLPATVTIVSTPSGASVTINGQAQEGVTPMTLELAAGTYEVGLNLAGYDATTVEVQAQGGVTLEQQVTLAQTIVVPPPVVPMTETAPEPQKKSMVPAYVTLGLGAAGLVSGTIFGIMALNSKSKFKDDPTVDHADAAERNALIADMSFGIALTLGLTGIVLLTSSDAAPAESAKKKHGSKTEFAWAPYAGPRGGGAAARLKF